MGKRAHQHPLGDTLAELHSIWEDYRRRCGDGRPTKQSVAAYVQRQRELGGQQRMAL